MKHDPWKTKVARIAALRARAKKQRVVAELAEARRRGEDPAARLAKLEADALGNELLGRQQ